MAILQNQKPRISILLSIRSFMLFPGKISVLHIRISRNKFPNNLVALSSWKGDHTFVGYFFCSVLFWIVHFPRLFVCQVTESHLWLLLVKFIPLLHCLLFSEHFFPPENIFSTHLNVATFSLPDLLTFKPKHLKHTNSMMCA